MARHLRAIDARGENRDRARPDEGAPARERDARLHREPRQSAGLHGDHRIGARHSQRQHDDHQPRRPFRSRPALPAARPGRALTPEGLRLPADPGRAHHHARRQAPHRGPARAGRGRKRRRLQACDSRPRASRRRQSARPRAVGPDHGGRLRAVHRDDGAGDPRAARRAGASRFRARTAARHSGLYARQLRARRERAAGAVPADGAGGFREPISTSCATRCAIASDRCRPWSRI